MLTLRYVIVEKPTKAKPIKYPRMVGKTNHLKSSKANCLKGEILVATDLNVNLKTWEGLTTPMFVDDKWIEPDYSNDTRMYCVELIDGIPTVVLTEDSTDK